ncbi:unnamed protein product [Spirodela intermedia]|uniref:Selenoprotein O n=1 Tax=Spirodela intermedia TaxID=51605 RepID=A0A7I8LFH9_SPIIN|nr:unnamed protein product [Spirodela intermedia]
MVGHFHLAYLSPSPSACRTALSGLPISASPLVPGRCLSGRVPAAPGWGGSRVLLGHRGLSLLRGGEPVYKLVRRFVGFAESPSMEQNQAAESPVASAERVGESAKNSKERARLLPLEELNWDHSFVRELPGDPRTDSTPREVVGACYSKISPSAKVGKPELVAWSESVAELLELDPAEFQRPDFPAIFSGASPLAGGLPYAQCYGGHQFGVWAGQLGDGRAITIGELVNSRGGRWELQLKGAGKTPYSRFADGLAVLRSSVREFLASEAMHGLGIPTTRALSLVTTGELVYRDMFYDGNPKQEPGAIVCRVSPSFLRFGSFQIHASRGGEHHGIVRLLADYAIRHHFPHLENTHESEASGNKYAEWAMEVAERTASLVAGWQGVGFTHGVLNTDNMSLLGLTIDYGPFGFLDAFDPSYTPNTTDLPGRRYCFANQPDVCLWNVAQFASTLSAAKLITEEEANQAMERYGDKFMEDYKSIMTRKLGLPQYNKELVSKLLTNLSVDKVDYTNFFRRLSNLKAASADMDEKDLLAPLKAVLLDIGPERKVAWISWVKSYVQELVSGSVPDEQRKAAMDAVNPKYVLRNYLCQSAIDAAEQGDYDELRRLLKVVQRPYDEQPGMEKYARLPPAWAYRPGVAMLSCSS